MGQKVLNHTITLHASAPAGLLERVWPDVETSSEAYKGRFAGAVGKYMLEVQERSVLSLLSDLPPGATVLDVGGGHGQLAGPLARQGLRVTVLGSSPACSGGLTDEISQGLVAFQAADFSRLPYADESFDAVVCIRLMAHVDEWPELMSELCRVARRTVLIDYPTYASLNLLSLATFSVKRAIEKTTRTYRSFWPDEISHAFAQNGFGRPQNQPQFVLPMAAHRLMGGSAVMQKIETLAHRFGLTQRFGNPVLARADRV